MPLFGRNPNETAFAGGRKNWAEVIRNSGPGNILVWRQPEEDFNTNSTLIVMHGEEAVFIKGGVIEQTFDSGTYTLSTENYPFISRLRNAFTGGISTFSCVVYFVRTAHSAEIRWGTSSPIHVRDKVLGIPTKLLARGSYRIQVNNPQLFLKKLIGNNVNVVDQQELLDDYFADEFQGKIRSILTTALNETQTELLGIESRTGEFGEAVEPHLVSVFEDYGLEMIKFTIGVLEIADDEYRHRAETMLMNARETTMMSQAEAAARINLAHGARGEWDVLGDDWGRVQAKDILRDLANNPGSGGLAAAGAGMGMGMAAGSAFGNMAQQMFNPMQPAAQAPAAPAPSGRFATKAPESASGPPAGEADDPVAKLKKLKEMLDLGLIEQFEYDAKKTEIMSKM